MGFFNTNKKDEHLILLFGIGSGSVGGALIRFTKATKGDWTPNILTQARTLFPFKEDLNFDDFLKGMNLALKTTAEKIYNAKKGAPESIHCNLASPWYVSETRKVHLEKPTPFVITEKLMENMIDTELKNVVKLYEEKYKDVTAKPYLLEKKVLSCALNGYNVNNPLNRKATTLNMNLFISISPDTFIKNIKQTVESIFHHKEISFGSFISSMFITARDRFINEPSYFLIDINAEITDIGIVANEVLIATMSFPMGKNSAIRAIVSKLKKTEMEARSMFSMFSEDSLSQVEMEKVKAVLEPVRNEWVRLFTETLAMLPKTIYLPSNIFLVADFDSSVWFASILREKEYVEYVPSQKHFNVITIDGISLLDMCKVSDSICDQFLMVEAIALSRMLKI